MKQPICSIDHFERLLKFFRKISYKQITENPKYQEDKLKQLTFYTFWKHDLLGLDEKLLKVFKCNPHKTRSGFSLTLPSPYYEKPVTWYVSYTVENNSRRTAVSENAFLAYRIYMKVGNGQKHRVVRCRVPMNWVANKHL